MPVRRADLTMHELDGEALIFDSASGNTHRLNDTALFIWRHCDGRQDPAEVTERMTQTYDVSPAQAAGHVERMLREFADQRLVV
jgi:PqqD family protein of HPr-rel-A system